MRSISKLSSDNVMDSKQEHVPSLSRRRTFLLQDFDTDDSEPPPTFPCKSCDIRTRGCECSC